MDRVKTPQSISSHQSAGLDFIEIDDYIIEPIPTKHIHQQCILFLGQVSDRETPIQSGDCLRVRYTVATISAPPIHSLTLLEWASST